jgi:hypothetical protein
MRLAKNRAQLESANAQAVAHLTLNAAAALVTGGSASAALYLAAQAPSVISPIPRDDDDGIIAKIGAGIADFAKDRALRIKRLSDKHPTPGNTRMRWQLSADAASSPDCLVAPGGCQIQQDQWTELVERSNLRDLLLEAGISAEGVRFLLTNVISELRYRARKLTEQTETEAAS